MQTDEETIESLLLLSRGQQQTRVVRIIKAAIRYYASDDEEFEVYNILKRRQGAVEPEYLIRWTGYCSTDDTWEPESAISHLDLFLDLYKLPG
jgi:hypothetical protein